MGKGAFESENFAHLTLQTSKKIFLGDQLFESQNFANFGFHISTKTFSLGAQFFESKTFVKIFVLFWLLPYRLGGTIAIYPFLNTLLLPSRAKHAF